MQRTIQKRRVAVVSPTIDKRHGTERRVAECVTRLSEQHEIHVYSKRVEDLDLSRITWHRIPDIPGPHLVRYLWWFAANHIWRWWDTRLGRPDYDLVYSPGINCLDANVVTVHILFSEYRRRVQNELRLSHSPPGSWLRLIHRQLYYRLISSLEKRVYPRPSLALGAVSAKVSEELRRSFGRTNHIRVVYQGIDLEVFNPEARLRRRAEMRRGLGIRDEEFVTLLIGNDWKNKGLPCLLEAMAGLRDLPMKLLVVGSDDRPPFEAHAKKVGLIGPVRFYEPSPDVMQFYAAADVYVGPSLHDSFALPPSEAMACALPVITSRTNGGAEMITDRVDGLILEDPRDSEELARMIRRLYQEPELRERLGRNALRTAQKYTWERNVDEMRLLFEEAFNRRAARGPADAAPARPQSGATAPKIRPRTDPSGR